ncbi:15752_t:CDS:1, partial [Cetraspora pellucida]
TKPQTSISDDSDDHINQHNENDKFSFTNVYAQKLDNESTLL